MADAANTEVIFKHSKFNGDGIIARDSFSGSDGELLQTFEDIIKAKGPVKDRGGQAGIDSGRVKDFFSELRAYERWWNLGQAKRAESPAFAPLKDHTQSAYQALVAVARKIDDYFCRCRLAAFDGRSKAALSREAALFGAIAKEDLSLPLHQIAELPLARVSTEQELRLDAPINPEWSERLQRFHICWLGETVFFATARAGSGTPQS